jgi:hypothetical protein
MMETIDTMAGSARWKIPFEIEPSVIFVVGADSDFIE